jgi:signal transduction histidine kinase
VLEAALNETSCGFVVMNHERKITFSNKAAPLNVDSNGVSSLSLIFNGQETLDAWLEDCDKNAVHAERTWSRISNKLPEEEGRRFFDVIASYDKGAESEVVLTLIDRTSIYEVGEQELDFIAFAAHELRGPITVIRGYLDVLEDELGDVLKDDQHELFRRLTVSANRLSGYINNILNTSRYDRRHLKMHLSETTVAEIYDTIRDDMDLRASAQTRMLSVNIPTDLPTIAGDPASLSEVFGNLIDNAIKYSNEGGAIAVTARLKDDMVEVIVEDHGIGMPANVIGNLFQKFYRSHRSRETVAGTGIGLYISKAIVESHGGTISVRSEDGQGSTFTVLLPTFKSVADKLKAGNNSNEGLIDQGSGWIKNHSMYRG